MENPQNQLELALSSLAELPQAAKQLLEYLNGRKKMFFYGEIGAGKTTFIQAFCAHLGVKEEVVSPTYSLVNQYVYQDQNTQEEAIIHHLDLYRLQSLEEAIDIGIEEYLYDNNYCLIEWPELIETLAPIDTVKIYLELLDNSIRKALFL